MALLATNPNASAPRRARPLPGGAFPLTGAEGGKDGREKFILNGKLPPPAGEALLTARAGLPRIALVGGFTPRRCGIAFTNNNRKRD